VTAPEAPAAVEHKLTLPRPTAPTLVLDDESGTCWIGLPLNAMKFVEASVILDETKSHVYKWYKRNSAASKIIRPVLNGVANGFRQTRDFLIRAKK